MVLELSAHTTSTLLLTSTRATWPTDGCWAKGTGSGAASWERPGPVLPKAAAVGTAGLRTREQDLWWHLPMAQDFRVLETPLTHAFWSLAICRTVLPAAVLGPHSSLTWDLPKAPPIPQLFCTPQHAHGDGSGGPSPSRSCTYRAKEGPWGQTGLSSKATPNQGDFQVALPGATWCHPQRLQLLRGQKQRPRTRIQASTSSSL